MARITLTPSLDGHGSWPQVYAEYFNLEGVLCVRICSLSNRETNTQR